MAAAVVVVVVAALGIFRVLVVAAEPLEVLAELTSNYLLH